MKILTLDISSSTIGWATMIQEPNKDKPTLVSYGYIKPLSKKKSGDNLYLRLNSATKVIEKILKDEKPDQVIVEDYVKGFSRGRSSANTIILLAVFNETISLQCFNFTGVKPLKYSVTTVRAFVSDKLEKKIKEKEEVVEFIDEHFDNYNITLNRVGNIKAECGDESDAIILGVYHFML